MATLQNQINQLKKLKKKTLEKEVEAILKQFSNILIELNREQLKDNRLNINEQEIGFYSKATEVISNGRKKAGEPFNLFDTGLFQKGLFVSIKGDDLIFDSRDSKSELIKEKYKDILGLSDNDRIYFINTTLKPKLLNYIRTKLNV